MSLRGRLSALVVLAAVTVPAVPASARPAPNEADVVAGEVLVKWAPGASASARAAEQARHGLRTAGAQSVAGYERLEIDPRKDPRAVSAALRKGGAASQAQPNFIYRAAGVTLPNDPAFSKLWGLHQANDVDLDVPEAWQQHRGAAGVVVAVLDTGIDIGHPDLRANIWTNRGEVASNGIDDDRNGYVDDVNGWDFHNSDATVYDDPDQDGHGTHIAGTIAAVADNGTGVAGVAPAVKVMPLKFLGGADGAGTTTQAMRAIAYAKSQGVDVINASWAGAGGSSDLALRDAIAGSGTVFVAAAGNTGADNDVVAVSPANLAADNILSVASIDASGALSAFSNRGARTVDLAAPGSNIVSTWSGGKYASSSGTSMAVPHVAGVAALVRSMASGASELRVVELLRSAAEANPLPSLEGRTVTGGIPNAPTAVALAGGTSVDAPVTEPVAEPTTEPISGGGGGGGGGTAPAPTAPVDEPDTEEPAAGPVVYDGSSARTLDLACPSVAPTGWTDVLAASPHAAGIGCATQWEVFLGGSASTFLPETRLSRGQLASVLARAIEQATGSDLPAGEDRFADDDGSVHAGAIDALAAIGIVGGVDADTYAPTAPVTRAQFASMLARTYDHLVGSLPRGADVFSDDEGNPHESATNALAALGVVTGDGKGSYLPAGVLTRAQSATMVARLIDALVEADVAG